MDRRVLDEREVAVLYVLAITAKGSIHAHFPREAIVSKFREEMRGYIADALGRLCRHPEGLVMQHPTRGGMTYQITKTGLARLNKLRLI